MFYGSCTRMGISATDLRNMVKKHLLFPGKIAHETKDRNVQQHKVEHRIGPQPRNDIEVLGREADRWCDDSVYRQERHGEEEGTGNGSDGVLCPDAAHGG